MSASGVAVEIVVGISSGFAGALVGAGGERLRYRKERRDRERELLWQYERALRDQADSLTYFEYHGVERSSALSPEDVDRTRGAAYALLQSLPDALGSDLTDPWPEPGKSSFEAGDELHGLANRLAEHLRSKKRGVTPRGRRRAVARAAHEGREDARSRAGRRPASPD